MKIVGVTESATRNLRHEIITGQIPPGSKLNEMELSNRYGISRPPLREAFRKLEYENLVTNIPRKGTYITEISVQDCEEVYFTRRVIECAAVDALAAKPICDVRSLHTAIEKAHSAVLPAKASAEELVNYYKEITQFHSQMIAACNNRWLTHCYNSISATLARYQIIYLSTPGTWQPALEDHIVILRCIEKRQLQEAKEHLNYHIVRTLESLIEKMQDEDARFLDQISKVSTFGMQCVNHPLENL